MKTNDGEFCCDSCGTAWRDHLGPTGLCRERMWLRYQLATARQANCDLRLGNKKLHEALARCMEQGATNAARKDEALRHAKTVIDWIRNDACHKAQEQADPVVERWLDMLDEELVDVISAALCSGKADGATPLSAPASPFCRTHQGRCGLHANLEADGRCECEPCPTPKASVAGSSPAGGSTSHDCQRERIAALEAKLANIEQYEAAIEHLIAAAGIIDSVAELPMRSDARVERSITADALWIRQGVGLLAKSCRDLSRRLATAEGRLAKSEGLVKLARLSIDSDDYESAEEFAENFRDALAERDGK